LNGGPQFTPDEAISFQVLCQDQAEIDRYWDALVDGGSEQPCGWLKDRFGVSWQVFPTSLYGLLSEGDPDRIERATAAVLSTFGKLDMAAIEAAANGA
jgi:predicted 3-demethylubiquinone-9 3-methyltransferase (glyoxalase superfamily)